MKGYNFFEYFEGEKGGLESKTTYAVIGAACVIGIMITLFVVNCFRINWLKRDIASLENNINSKEYKITYREKEQGERNLKILKDYYKLVSSAEGSVNKKDYINTDLIDDISSTVPKSVSFQNITVSDKTVTIQGTSQTRVSVGELEHNLKELGIFEEVHVPDISENSNDENSYSFNFNISFKLKEGKTNEK
ncbi:PilN domain-containing protein [Clostridium massiliodielmoense]|uniref:PilN domain-containing protein n=1 Tax=Clostridium massiliodielmoense TaxID=1776385 RepID=UPI000A270D7C|nr:PilN domain-containing protein [Clostridium massiliodielmoense]